MTEKEKFMYQIMGNISASEAPIVFKGALITKLILNEGGYTAVERQTKDIDANWVGAPPSMDALVDTINNSFNDLKSRIYAVPFRDYGEKISAGISIRERQTDEEIISMDIDMRPIHGSKIYKYGEICIRGVLVNAILADKITVLSERMVFRRAKDMVDVYALSHCVKVNTSEIYEVFGRNPDREIGKFAEFIHRRQDVEHAYEKLRGIENKPPFEQVYEYLRHFIHPFINEDKKPRVWNSKKLTWDAEPVTRNRTFKEKLADGKKKAAEYDTDQPQPKRGKSGPEF